MTAFKNPWHVAALRAANEPIHQYTLRLPARITAYFEGMHGPGGEPVIQTTANLFLKEVYDELQHRGHGSDYDPRAYESAVVDLLDRIRRAPSVPEPSGQAAGGNDGCGTTGVAPETPRCDILPAVVDGGSTGKGTRTRKARAKAS